MNDVTSTPPPTPSSEPGDPPSPVPTRWHSEWSLDERRAYTERFVRIAASGEDVHGEARFVDAFAARGSVILDAGCGTGRLAAELTRRGHLAVGLDADEMLIEAGRQQHPGLPLATLDLTRVTSETLAASGLPTDYDVIVAAGNVMVFLAPGTEQTVVSRLAGVLRPGGRAIFGFQVDRHYTHDDLDLAAAAAGWIREYRFGTWQGDPFDAPGPGWPHSSSGWATSVYRAPPAPTV